MKVILLAKVPGLGNVDDIVDAAEGHAVNYLFPQHLAVLASGKALDELNRLKVRKVKEAESDLKEQQSLASRLDGLPVTFAEKTNEAGFLYAAVGPQKISDALHKMGFDIYKNRIFSKPIKEPGEYDVRVKLRHKLEALIHLTITAVENERK